MPRKRPHFMLAAVTSIVNLVSKVHWSHRASIPVQQGGQPQVQRGAGQGDADGQAHGQVKATTNRDILYLLISRLKLMHIRDVYCKNCDSKLGWMYEFATEDNQRWCPHLSMHLF